MCDEKKLHKTPPFCAAFLFDIVNYMYKIYRITHYRG